MTECHRPAIDIHLVAVEFQIADEFLGHNGKGFVDFPKINIVRCQPGPFQNLLRRRDRRVQHERRAVSHIRRRHDSGARLEVVLLCIVRRGQQQRGGTIDNSRGVPRMMYMVEFLDLGIFAGDQAAVRVSGLIHDDIAEHAEHGLEPGKTLQRGSGAREFFPVERDGTVLVLHRNDGIVKAAVLNGFCGACLAFHGKLVDGLAIDAFQRGDGVGADALL